MTKKRLKLCVLFLFGLGLTGIHAQESLNATGGNASSSGGSVSYSVGQVVYTTNTGGSIGSVAQGVQQPYEISIITALEEAQGIDLSITAFPNPTTDYLTLSTVNFVNKNLSFHLYDINGKMIQESKINVSETKISMTDLPPATYFLKITENQKDVKTFKIVKN